VGVVLGFGIVVVDLVWLWRSLEVERVVGDVGVVECSIVLVGCVVRFG